MVTRVERAGATSFVRGWHEAPVHTYMRALSACPENPRYVLAE